MCIQKYFNNMYQVAPEACEYQEQIKVLLLLNCYCPPLVTLFSNYFVCGEICCPRSTFDLDMKGR